MAYTIKIRYPIAVCVLCLLAIPFYGILSQPQNDQSAVSGSIKGVSGNTSVAPITIRVSDLPRLTQPYSGPTREIPRGIPPFVEKHSAPHVSEIRNITLDRNGKINEITPLAPTLGIGFEGITQQGYIPSEPTVAVGPINIFSTGNVSFTITDKDGSNRTEILQSTFLGIPSAEGPGFDAQCYYDAQRGRFVLLTETQVGPPSKLNFYYLAVSKTSDARGQWWIYKFDMTKDGSTQTNNWSDFPGLGVSDDKIVMSGQQFSFGGNHYQYQKLRVVDRAKVYNGEPVTYVDFVNFPNQVFVTKPGRNLSPDPTIYLLATRWNGGSDVVFGKITGTPSSPALSFGTSIVVQAYGAVVNAKGGSNTVTVNAGDARTPNFIVRNGFLAVAWHFGINFGSGTVDAIRYLKLNISNNPPTVVTDETFGADGIYYYYPNCVVDSAGTMFIGFGRSSATEFPSSWVSGKRRSDTSIQPSALAKSGTAVTSQSRWGDYTGIDMDEEATNGSLTRAWYAGQWTKASSTFGTWISQLTYTYGKIAGQILIDADGDSTTAGDRTPLAGWTVSLKQGTTTVASAITNSSGNFDLGYLETGTYDAVLSLQSGYRAMTTMPGSGGTTQTKIDSVTIHVNLTDAQTSAGNNFVVSNTWRAVSSGNWNSTSTWGAIVPIASSNVVIPSGITVTVNGNITCSNLSLDGTLQFDGSGGRTATINGILTLGATGSFTIGNNTLVLNGPSISGTASNLVADSTSSLVFGGSSAGISIPNSIFSLTNLTIDNLSGVSLGSALTLAGKLRLTTGEFSIAGGAMIVISSTDSGAVEITSGRIRGKIRRNLSANASGTFRFTNLHTYLKPTLNSIPITVDVTANPHTNVPVGDTSLSIKRYYTITPSAALTATLRLTYEDSELRPSMTESSLSLWRYNASGSPPAWVDELALQNSAGENWVEQVNISTWSDWTLAPSGSALPIQLASFTATISGGSNVLLEWTTLSEVNNYGFIVQQRLDGSTSFENIPGSFVPGNGTTLEQHYYSFTHENVSPGKYLYRLQQIDLDGQTHYSQTITVEVSRVTDVVEQKPAVFELHQNYPNPFNPTTTITFSVATAGHTKLVVYNLIGRVVAALFEGLAEPTRMYHVVFDAHELAAGVYFAKLESGTLRRVKKMVLLK